MNFRIVEGIICWDRNVCEGRGVNALEKNIMLEKLSYWVSMEYLIACKRSIRLEERKAKASAKA